MFTPASSEVVFTLVLFRSDVMISGHKCGLFGPDVGHLYVESVSTSIHPTLLFLHSITRLIVAYLVISASDEEVQED